MRGVEIPGDCFVVTARLERRSYIGDKMEFHGSGAELVRGEVVGQIDAGDGFLKLVIRKDANGEGRQRVSRTEAA